MVRIRSVCWGGVALAVLFAVGCVPVSEPLVDPAAARPDPDLFGVWQGERDGATWILTIGSAHVPDHPKGVMEAVQVEYNRAGKHVDGGGKMFFVAGPVGEGRFASVLLAEGTPLGQPGGMQKWLDSGSHRSWLLRYEVKGDTLTLWGSDAEHTSSVARDRGWKQENGFLQVDRPGLVEYLAKDGGKALFSASNKTVYRRLK